MANNKKRLLLSYIFYFLTMIIFYHSKIQGMRSPFFYAIIFAMLYFDVNILFLSFSYLLIVNLLELSLYTLTISLVILIIIILISFVHKSIKKPINKFLIIIYYLCVEGFLLYKNFCIENIVTMIIGVICLVCFINYLKSYYKKGNIIHFTIDQNICGAVFLVGVSLGLSQLPYFSSMVLKFFGIFLILIFTYTFDSSISVITAILLGIGYNINFDTTYLFYFSFVAIFCYGFKGYNVFVSCLSIIVAELVLGLYFDIFGYYLYVNLIPVGVALLLFLLFNKRLVNYAQHLFGVNKNTYGVKTLVNRNKEQSCYKMNELSQVFNEMNQLYASMINGLMEDDEVLDILLGHIIKNQCKDCKMRDDCYSEKEEERTAEDLKLLLKKGVEKGKVSILDVNSSINYKCKRINQLLNFCNNLIVNFKQYKQIVKSSDMSKLLVAEQLKGVASLLDMLSVEIGTTILFNNKMEEKIREELAYYDILCEEVLCYDINDETSVSIVVNNKDLIDTSEVEGIISKILKHSYSVTMEQIGYYGNVYEFKPSPKFGYIFGASGKGKGKVSGDTFSFTKISKNRVMFAICDGMGTGNQAQSISEKSLNLIENFYKAGYESQIILSSVNKLLSTGSEENYSALDIVVLDLGKGYSNFIKLGAPDGIIKTTDGLEKIRAGALPLGILEEIEPMILERNLKQNDMICLFSDGILDSFGSIELMMEFIDSQTTLNPQILADNILNQSLLYNNSLDDKTVICIRTFVNY